MRFTLMYVFKCSCFFLQLDYKVEEKKFFEVFSLAGRIVSVKLMYDKKGHSRGLAEIS
jgi:RNA recognition motif-containing protein